MQIKLCSIKIRYWKLKQFALRYFCDNVAADLLMTLRGKVTNAKDKNSQLYDKYVMFISI